MRYLSVCSGIEAASVAWGSLGWSPVAFSEIEPFPCSLLAHNYPDTPNWGDMTRWESWPNESVDILVGGTPCQSFSVAGKRAGMDDIRGQLAMSYVGIAAKYKPRWIVWENVPGVLTSGGGRDFASFVQALVECGYSCAWRVLDAQYFGLAQRRKRVFVVGSSRGWRHSAAVLFEPEGDKWDKQEDTKRAVSPTIQTTANDYSRADGFVIIDTGIGLRKLMTVEMERLMGFTDGYTNVPGVSDGTATRALGNSMAVPVMNWIGRRIQLVDGLIL